MFKKLLPFYEQQNQSPSTGQSVKKQNCKNIKRKRKRRHKATRIITNGMVIDSYRDRKTGIAHSKVQLPCGISVETKEW